MSGDVVTISLPASSASPARPSSASSQHRRRQQNPKRRQSPRRRSQRLSIAHAIRTGAVLDHAVERLALVGRLIHDQEQRRVESGPKQRRVESSEQTLMLGAGGANSDGLGVEMFGRLTSQRDLEDRFDELMRERSELQGLANRKKLLAVERELAEVRARLRESSSGIFSALRESEEARRESERGRRQAQVDVHRIQHLRRDLESLLTTTVDELQMRQFPSLTKKVQQHHENKQLLLEHERNEAQVQRTIEHLERDIRTEHQQFEQDMEAKNARIQELMDATRRLKQEAKVQMRMDQERKLADVEAEQRARNRHLGDLMERIDDTDRRSMNDTFVHERVMPFLQQRHEDMVSAEAHWQDKFEHDSAALQAELDELQAQRDQDFERLQALRERWELEEERERERAVAVEERERALHARRRLDVLFYVAQCRIRFWWRCHKRRKAAAASKKKKKRKGKKGKGKKSKSKKRS